MCGHTAVQSAQETAKGSESCIGGDMGGIEAQDDFSALLERPIVAHIVLVEGVGVLSQDHIAVIGSDGGSHARTRAPQVFLDFLGRAISLLLVGTLLTPSLQSGSPPGWCSGT